MWGQDVWGGVFGAGMCGADVWGSRAQRPAPPAIPGRHPSAAGGESRGSVGAARPAGYRTAPRPHISLPYGAPGPISPPTSLPCGAPGPTATHPCPMGRLAPYLPLTSLCYDAPTAPHIPALWCTQPYSPTYPCPMGHPAPHPYPMGRPTPYPPPRHPCPMTHPQPHISLPYGAPGSTAPHIPALWGTPPHSPIHPSPPIPPL